MAARTYAALQSRERAVRPIQEQRQHEHDGAAQIRAIVTPGEHQGCRDAGREARSGDVVGADGRMHQRAHADSHDSMDPCIVTHITDIYIIREAHAIGEPMPDPLLLTPGPLTT